MLRALDGSGIRKIVAESTFGAQPGEQIGDLGGVERAEEGLLDAFPAKGEADELHAAGLVVIEVVGLGPAVVRSHYAGVDVAEGGGGEVDADGPRKRAGRGRRFGRGDDGHRHGAERGLGGLEDGAGVDRAEGEAADPAVAGGEPGGGEPGEGAFAPRGIAREEGRAGEGVDQQLLLAHRHAADLALVDQYIVGPLDLRDESTRPQRIGYGQRGQDM